jgi:hypothetical protein
MSKVASREALDVLLELVLRSFFGAFGVFVAMTFKC